MKPYNTKKIELWETCTSNVGCPFLRIRYWVGSCDVPEWEIIDICSSDVRERCRSIAARPVNMKI